MRKLVAGLFITLDGVVETPSKWVLWNDEVGDVMNAGIAQSDAILLGTRTYLDFVEMWSQQSDDVPMARFLNNTPKYIASSTLDTVDWANAHLLTGDLADALADLKAQPGKNIQIPGSPRLVRSLLRDGLLDELNLLIHPIVVGSGMRLFDEMTDEVTLELVKSSALGNGVLSVTYRPINR